MLDKAKRPAVNILLISGQATDIREIKDLLWKSEELTYHVQHRPDFFGSIDLLGESGQAIDVILLDLGVFGSARSREVFRRMVNMAHGIPIIVFTDREDHDMALLAIEDGAADNITRGQGDTDIFKFRDAIEFAMARAEISKNLENQSRTKAEIAQVEATARLESAMNNSAADMDHQKNQYTALVKNILERGEADIALAVKEISEALKESELKNTILVAQLKNQDV